MDNRILKASPIIGVLKILIGMYIVTGILLLLLTWILFKFELSENQVSVGVIMIYVIACVLGGLIIGKTKGAKKFLWGLVTAGLYFAILTIVSITVNGGIQNELTNVITTLVICLGSGMVGGMIG